MKFPPSLLDEIRARLPVSDVIGRRVKLQKRGREFVGLSPFNSEKTPSFTVNDQKGFYHCFSSGKHGDIFSFLTEVEGLSFPEAVERLAHEAGVAMPERSAEVEQQEKKRTGLLQVMELAQAFFVDALQSQNGALARGYLNERGVTSATQQVYGLGYAPSGRYDLKQFLNSKNVSQDEMIEAGLIIGGADIAVSYDRFRNRVMFPIMDVKGRVIAFGGRALADDQSAKYLNSPETPLFHKGHVLYNVSRARQAAYDQGKVIAVEGYMDVIALGMAGFDNAVAPLGTALTESQLRLLWRMSPEPILCFDGDKAGLKAAYRAIDLALPMLAPGQSVRFALLPDGLDPDDLIKAQGREAFEQVVNQALPLINLLWRREAEIDTWQTPEKRALLERRIMEAATSITDQKVRHHYEAALRDRLQKLWQPAGAEKRKNRQFRPFGTGARTGNWQGGRYKSSRQAPGVSEALKKSTLARNQQGWQITAREALLFMTIINHPGMLDEVLEEFSSLEFSIAELDKMRSVIIDIASCAQPLENQDMKSHLVEHNCVSLLERLEAALTHGSDRFIQGQASEEEAICGWRQAAELHIRAFSLRKELNVAELAYVQDSSDENFKRLTDIRSQLSSADGIEAREDGVSSKI